MNGTYPEFSSSKRLSTVRRFRVLWALEGREFPAGLNPPELPFNVPLKPFSKITIEY